MPDVIPYAIRRLLLDAEYGIAEVQKYSKLSVFARCQPLFITAVLAAVAVLGSIFACEATRGLSE